MKLFIVILLINFVYLFGDKFGSRIHKKQLRGMHKEYHEDLLQQTFVTTFDNVYNQITDHAKMGQNEYRFSIMCHDSQITDCEIHNINKNREWSRDHPYITNKQFATNIINALHQTFPDSNITQIYKNCCDYNIIEW